MRITAMRLNNVTCWHNLELKELTKFNALIGENSTGKSSILLALLACLTGTGYNTNMFTRDKTNGNILIRLSFSENDVENLLFEWKKQGANKEHCEALNHKHWFWNSIGWKGKIDSTGNFSTPFNSPSNIILLNQNSDEISDLNTWFQSQPMRPAGNSLVIQIREYVRNQVVHIPARRRIIGESISNLYSFSNTFNGSSLKGMLHDAKNSGDVKRVKDFHRFQEIVKNWSFSPGTPDIKARAGNSLDLIFWKEDETSILIEEVGDGVKEAVIIAGECLTYPEKIFLIEEPELHLHPRALRELREMLKHEITGQVFISTHSPTFVNEMDQETTIIRTEQRDSGSKAILISNKSDILAFRKEFGLLNSDFLFEDVIVYVEGYSDKQAFERWFELLYPTNISVRFLAVGGEKEIKPALFLSLMLQLDQKMALFSVVDSDRKTPEVKKREIIEELRGRNPQLFDQFGEEKINEFIYVLEQDNLESYIANIPRVIAEWLEVDVEEVTEFLGESGRVADKKLMILAKKYGKTFRKARDDATIVRLMEKYEIDDEIRRFFEKVNSVNEE